MGKVLKELSRIKLPEREKHNSRIFVDLCENIHIHYREFRIVFALEEYFEFVDVLLKSTEDVRSYLAQNPDYEERKYKTTLMIAGGKGRQRKPIKNSPKPNQSMYFNNNFSIELQDENVIDEIHVHWRDYRFSLNRRHFKQIAKAFIKAKKKLDEFEKEKKYIRKFHRDRQIVNFEKEFSRYRNHNIGIMGEKNIKCSQIKTRFKNIEKQNKFDQASINLLKDLYESGKRVFPILLSTEKNGDHYIIDGNHRFLAAKKANLRNINCIITDITFEQSSDFRKAESLLKKFDMKTNYRFNTSSFNKEFFAYKMNTYYKNHFYRALNPSFKTKLKNLIKKNPKIFNSIKRIKDKFSD